MSVAPRARRNLVVPVILVLNLIVFAMWNYRGLASPRFMVDNFTVSWDAIAEGRYWTLLTSVFSHNLLLHLFINMFVLNSFGSFLETVLGRRRFLLFYLVAGILSSLAHSAVSAWLLGQPDLPAVGASGAIAGLVLVFSLMFPKEKILLFGFIPMPAIIGAFAFIALDLWGLTAQAEGGGLPIGHGAHLGGAFTGIVYYLAYIRPRWRNRHET